MTALSIEDSFGYVNVNESNLPLRAILNSANAHIKGTRLRVSSAM